jgi:hypothetical protein
VKTTNKSVYNFRKKKATEDKKMFNKILIFIILVSNIIVIIFAADANQPPPFSSLDIVDDLLQATINRPSPSSFPSHFSQRTGDKLSSESQRADFEDTIARTAGTNCHQSAGSSYTCDMCCNGNCCENPSTWTPKSSSLDNAQSWIPVRFAFVIPTSFSLGSLPSQQDQKTLIGRTNQAFQYFPFRFLYSSQTIIQNDTVWNQCATDPCFTSSSCGFLNILLPAVNADVHNEIVIIMCHGISYLGEAQFPWAAPSVQYVQLQLNKGMTTPTIVHELGHYLGLFHVFEGSCSTADQGDWVSDTPQASSANGNCFIVKDSCPGLAGVDDSYNFMNYGLNWDCNLHFTDGQLSRAIAAMEYYRPTLVKNTKISLTSSNAVNNTSSNSVERTPACTTYAETFNDCWCENPDLDPSTWCKSAAPPGTTFTAGATPAPRSNSVSSVSFSCSILLVVFMMLITIGVSVK